MADDNNQDDYNNSDLDENPFFDDGGQNDGNENQVSDQAEDDLEWQQDLDGLFDSEAEARKKARVIEKRRRRIKRLLIAVLGVSVALGGLKLLKHYHSKKKSPDVVDVGDFDEEGASDVINMSYEKKDDFDDALFQFTPDDLELGEDNVIAQVEEEVGQVGDETLKAPDEAAADTSTEQLEADTVDTGVDSQAQAESLDIKERQPDIQDVKRRIVKEEHTKVDTKGDVTTIEGATGAIDLALDTEGDVLVGDDGDGERIIDIPPIPEGDVSAEEEYDEDISTAEIPPIRQVVDISNLSIPEARKHCKGVLRSKVNLSTGERENSCDSSVGGRTYVPSGRSSRYSSFAEARKRCNGVLKSWVDTRTGKKRFRCIPKR